MSVNVGIIILAGGLYFLIGVIIMIFVADFFDQKYPPSRRSKSADKVINSRVAWTFLLWPLVALALAVVWFVALMGLLVRPIGALFSANPFRKLDS